MTKRGLIVAGTFRVVDVEGGGSYQKKVSSAKDVEYKVQVQAGDSEGHFGPTSQPVFAALPTDQGLTGWLAH